MNIDHPVATIRRVSPRCARCSAPLRTMADGRGSLIFRDGPVVCRDCVHMAGRLANVARHDDNAREGYR